jgi:hypothetical protein
LCVVILKLMLDAALSHVQSSTDVCWYAERGVLSFLVCCPVDDMYYCMVYNPVVIFLHFTRLCQIIVEA